ncbi:MAG: PIN domain-containing protein [Planctomycetaceae bacterium]|nr:PIN domain-containing protein [Planctomycetaceae bacterium]
MGKEQTVLARHRTIAIDTCVLIYYLEDHPAFGAAAAGLLEQFSRPGRRVVMSTMALLEVQVKLYRDGHDQAAREQYALLMQLPEWSWVSLTYQIADLAAELRGIHRLSVPDAVHIATAMTEGATLFVTNDRELPKVEGIELLIL